MVTPGIKELEIIKIMVIIIIIIIIIRPGGLGSWQTGRDYPNDSIAKNGQNPEMSPGNLRRLAVTQTPVKGLLKGQEDFEVGGWVEALLRMARILRKVLESWGDLLFLKLQWKSIS